MEILSDKFNKDQLMLSKEYNTYFIDVNKKMDKKYFEKIW